MIGNPSGTFCPQFSGSMREQEAFTLIAWSEIDRLKYVMLDVCTAHQLSKFRRVDRDVDDFPAKVQFQQFVQYYHVIKITFCMVSVFVFNLSGVKLFCFC